MSRRWLQMGMLVLLGWGWSCLPVVAQERNYTIQVGSLPTEEEAREMVGRLKTAGIEAYVVQVTLPGMGMRYRVRYGRFKRAEEAQAMAERAVKRGQIATYIVTIEESSPERAAERRREPIRPRLVPLLPDQPFPAPRSADEAPAPPSVERSHPTLPAIKILDERWKVAPPTALPDRQWLAIHFIDQLTGWIAGESGALYRTTDGGRTWKASPIDTSASLYSLCFLDWNRGWVLGRAGNKKTTLLFSTENGGRTWNQTAVPEITKLIFVDALAGWAIGSGPSLLKTLDGGLNWTPLETGYLPMTSETRWSVDDLYFIDWETGWLAASRQSPNRTRIGGLWKTSDAGQTWVPLPLPAELGDREEEGKPGRWRAIRFFSPTEGVLTGELLEDGPVLPFSISTRDGGQTWSMSRSIDLGSFIPHFIDPAVGWTIHASEPGNATQNETRILVTRNGGSSWATEISIAGTHRLLPFFLSRQHGQWGWMVGERGLLLTYRQATGVPGALKN